MLSQPESIDRLSETSPKDLELLFRALVYRPSASIFIADDDRRYGSYS